jgi:hypothetical protein
MVGTYEENVALVLHNVDDLRLVGALLQWMNSVSILFKEPAPVKEPQDGGKQLSERAIH